MFKKSVAVMFAVVGLALSASLAHATNHDASVQAVELSVSLQAFDIEKSIDTACAQGVEFISESNQENKLLPMQERSLKAELLTSSNSFESYRAIEKVGWRF